MAYDILQENLRQYVNTITGANPVYVPLYYQGPCIGCEFLTYSAKKLYIAFEIEFSNLPAMDANNAFAHFYDAANVLNFVLTHQAVAIRAADVPNFLVCNVATKNIYFSRFDYATYHQVRFNGIKVTWP